MRIHSLEHEPFEGLANIEVWAKSKGHKITRTRIYKNEEFPDTDDFDWLIIMGGSMSVYDEEKYPWLIPEKKFIGDAIAKKKILLGVCLGSQLIADVLCGKVSPNTYKEIGWFPVSLTAKGKESRIFGNFPHEFTAFQWHGDTFMIPDDALKISQSEACKNQAFEYGKVIGIQFHLEYSKESINLMLENCSEDLIDGKYIQKADEIISKMGNLDEMNKLLNLLLDNMEKKFG
jgi:GMP synthase-like glutamine amidotransferase